jgi:DNA-nicking Smr family endonuclease
MAKKKKPQAAQQKAFDSSPFNSLKGLAVSDAPSQQKIKLTSPVVEKTAEVPGSFADEMALLEVRRLDAFVDADDDEFLDSRPPLLQRPPVSTPQNDEEVFLQALGDLDVRFNDQYPDEDLVPAASARRMKQLKQGKLIPEASLDLHGLPRAVVAEKLRFFLQDAQHHGWSTLLVITGKGLHSEGGEAVLRNEAERFFAGEGRKSVAEWGRAPKQYGGDGALVLFLRKSRPSADFSVS